MPAGQPFSMPFLLGMAVAATLFGLLVWGVWAFYSNPRRKRRRELVKKLKQHIDDQNRQFDSRVMQLDGLYGKNFQDLFEEFKRGNPMPEEMRPTTKISRQNQPPSSPPTA